MKQSNIRKTIVISALMALLLSANALAVDISSSELGAGIKNMLNDVSKWLVILCPTAGGLSAVYFLIRRAMADEQDGKLWEKRIKVAIACGVAGTLVSGIIALIASYFGA